MTITQKTSNSFDNYGGLSYIVAHDTKILYLRGICTNLFQTLYEVFSPLFPNVVQVYFPDFIVLRLDSFESSRGVRGRIGDRVGHPGTKTILVEATSARLLPNLQCGKRSIHLHPALKRVCSLSITVGTKYVHLVQKMILIPCGLTPHSSCGRQLWEAAVSRAA